MAVCVMFGAACAVPEQGGAAPSVAYPHDAEPSLAFHRTITRLRNDRTNHLAVNVGEAEVAPGIAVGNLGVIQP